MPHTIRCTIGGFSWIRFVLVSLGVLVVASCGQSFADEPAVAAAKVNVPGEPFTWYGTAEMGDIGSVLDRIAMPPYDLEKTYDAHQGKQEGDTASFVLKTPRPGRHVFAAGVLTGKDHEVLARYRTGDKWTALPVGKVQPSYPRSWQVRKFCYWIDIPAGQTETAFEITMRKIGGQAFEEDDPIGPPGVQAALVAEPRVDPFEGGSDGEHPMFEVYKPAQLNKTELGRAVVKSIWNGRGPKKLAEYEKIPGNYISAQTLAWSLAVDGLKYQTGKGKKFALMAGRKGAKMAGWATWGYPTEWHVPPEMVAGRQKSRTSERYQKLETAIVVTAMAVGYDLSADGMAKKDRETYRRALDHYAQVLYVESLLNPWACFYHDNWSGHLQGAIGLAGMALRGESRYAQDWVDRYSDCMEGYIEESLDSHGVHAETIRYLGFGMSPFILAGVALERQGGKNIFEVMDGRMSKLVRSIIYLTAPTGQDTRDFGDTSRSMQVRAHSGMPGNVMTMLLGLSHGSMGDYARWAARRGMRRSRSAGGETRTINANQGARALGYLLFQPGPEKAPQVGESFPLGWHARPGTDELKDHGYVVMRTGFDSADDIVFVLKAGNAQGGHGHPAQGSFTLDASGDYLSQPPGYTKWGRHNTKAYNLITIDGKGQVSDHSLADGRKENDGHIERFVHSAGADLCIANNKPAYDNGNNAVRRSLRYVLFVRKPQKQGYFVIVDDIDKDGRPHDYTWNFHTTANHQIRPDGKGDFVAASLTAKEFRDLWAKRGDERASYRVGDFRGKPSRFSYGSGWPGPSKMYPWVKQTDVNLRLAFVSPQEFSHKITYRGKDRGKMMAIPDHLQVTQKATEATFFTILYPENQRKRTAMPAIERISEKDLWGAKMQGDLVLFSRREGVWKFGDVETDARLVYVSRDEAGEVIAYAAAEATILKVAGHTIIESATKVTAAGPELTTDDGGEWRASSVDRGMPE